MHDPARFLGATGEEFGTDEADDLRDRDGEERPEDAEQFTACQDG